MSGSLAAQVPVSTRVADDTDQTNKVATMSATLATDVDDPLERVQAIYASTQSAKELTQAVRARKIQSVGEVAPPLLLNLASRAAWASNITDRVPRVANVVVSNVPGPAVPDLHVRSQGLRHLRRQRAARLRRAERHAA